MFHVLYFEWNVRQTLKSLLFYVSGTVYRSLSSVGTITTTPTSLLLRSKTFKLERVVPTSVSYGVKGGVGGEGPTVGEVSWTGTGEGFPTRWMTESRLGLCPVNVRSPSDCNFSDSLGLIVS